jgi:uncharacterized membrane protein
MLMPSLLLLHLLAAMVWVGGMFFALFCLRPASAQVLAPPQRLPLWVATLANFLRYTGIAVLLLLASGGAMLALIGPRNAPPGVHLMLVLGLLMALVFVDVWLRLFPRLRAHCDAQQWPDGAQVLDGIRRRVMLNLALGVAVVVAAVFAR